MNNLSYDLMEILVDASRIAESIGYEVKGNTRDWPIHIIEWSLEFHEKNKYRVWDGEYLDELYSFILKKSGIDLSSINKYQYLTVHGVREETDEDGEKYCEKEYNDSLAHFWTIYGVIEGMEYAIGDFTSREVAEDIMEKLYNTNI